MSREKSAQKNIFFIFPNCAIFFKKAIDLFIEMWYYILVPREREQNKKTK